MKLYQKMYIKKDILIMSELHIKKKFLVYSVCTCKQQANWHCKNKSLPISFGGLFCTSLRLSASMGTINSMQCKLAFTWR